MSLMFSCLPRMTAPIVQLSQKCFVNMRIDRRWMSQSIKFPKSASCSFSVDSAAYCDGYNEPLYHKMERDNNRTSFYRAAIQKHCGNKIVLDIGCGSLALLSMMAIEAGASKVYAIETNENAFKSASQLIESRGFSDKMEIFYGHSNDIQLPERCDIVIHEIIGEIASSEGVYAAIHHAKTQFLKPHNGIWSIPDYVRSYLIPVEIPDRMYWDSLEEKIIPNERCNTMNLWYYPLNRLLCGQHQWGLWEEMQFNGDMSDCGRDQFVMDNHAFIAERDGTLGGLLSAIEIGVDGHDVLSSKLHDSNCMWANKLMLLDQRVDVKKGDTIRVTAKTDATTHVLHYEFNVNVSTN